MTRSALAPGHLVEIKGPSDPADCPEAWRAKCASWSNVQQDASGERGQLLEFSEEAHKWLVATFHGTALPLREEHLRALETKDINEFDVLFGPKSDPDVLGSNLTDFLQEKGFVLCRLLLSPEDFNGMVDVAQRCVDEGLFTRLPAELESGYLGRGGQGKTMHLDMAARSTPKWIKSSALQEVEASFATVGSTLRPFTNVEFGFDIHSRSNTLVSFPLEQDEVESSFAARECTSEEASDFLAVMRRAKLAALVNAGPGVAMLTLTPKLENDTVEAEVSVRPGTFALFAPDRFRFSYTAPTGTLSLQTLFLDTPRRFGLSHLEGDLAALSNASGPGQPAGENATIVSLATRYGLALDEPDKLWACFSKAGGDSFSEFPLSRWDPLLYYDPEADPFSCKSYTNHGGFTEGVDLFDCRFFDISLAEARGMDPTQRQIMEVSYIALEAAGWTKKMLSQKSEQIGMFVGVDKNEWVTMPREVGSFSATGSAASIMSNRFSFALNLKGPSMTIDTACSASLVATHTAKLHLRNNKNDPCAACITTGINLLLSPLTFVMCCSAGMLSRKGRCLTYNATADGYARGEGTGSHCMKLHRWDKERGDLAVVAASNVNQDGRSASLTAPNGPSQERVTRAVIAEAGITPTLVDTTECHGTGTPLGDPIELNAYKKIISSEPRLSPVVITSSKTCLGHCEGGAGITGLIKCIMISMYAEGTPNLHMTHLNAHIDMDGFDGMILTENILMRTHATFNGVLSFGFGGTNASAQAWGQNLATSRSPHRDVYKLLIQRVEKAPAPEVLITSEDWEDWITDGPELDAKPGDAWNLELDESGAVFFAKREKVSRAMGSSFFITGTFNGWKHDALLEDSELLGLHATTITLGAGGETRFQIVADQDPSMTFCPPYPDCSRKSAPVIGPESAPQKKAWYLRGEEGDTLRVEFYRSEADIFSISWRQEK